MIPLDIKSLVAGMYEALDDDHSSKVSIQQGTSQLTYPLTHEQVRNTKWVTVDDVTFNTTLQVSRADGYVAVFLTFPEIDQKIQLFIGPLHEFSKKFLPAVTPHRSMAAGS